MLQERIAQDYIQAMKSRDKVASSTIGFLRASLKNVQIDKRAEQLSDQDVIAVIKKQIKQRQESIKQFHDGGREDLVNKESAEMEILKHYLPQELSAEELKVFIQTAIKETGASSMKDMGQVMKVVMAKTEGRADNKILSEMIKTALS